MAGHSLWALNTDRKSLVDSLIASRVSGIEVGDPGLAVGFAAEDQGISITRAAGITIKETGSEITPFTPMRIFSITKQFVCLAFLLLAEGERASETDSIRRWLPELPPAYEPVSVRHLMENSSGIYDVTEVLQQIDDIQYDAGALLSLYAQIDRLASTPGARWSYGNGPYELLGLIVERIAGDDLAAVLKRLITNPLGMRSTRLVRTAEEYDGLARLHMKRGGAFATEIMTPPATVGAAGALVSTLDDLLAWSKNLLSPQIGSPEIWRAMHRECVLKNGVRTGYCAGLLVDRVGAQSVIGHGGGVGGGSAFVGCVPELGIAVAAISNRHDWDASHAVFSLLEELIGTSPSQPPLCTRDRPVPYFLGQRTFVSAVSGGVARVPQSGAEDVTPTVQLDGFPYAIEHFEGGRVFLNGALKSAQMSIVVDDDMLVLSNFGHIDRFDVAPDGNHFGFAGQRAYQCGSRMSILIECDGRQPEITFAYGKQKSVLGVEVLNSHILRFSCQDSEKWWQCGILHFSDDYGHVSVLTRRLPGLVFALREN